MPSIKSICVFNIFLVCSLFAPSSSKFALESEITEIRGEIIYTSWVIRRSYAFFVEKLAACKPCVKHEKKLCMECYNEVICSKRKDELFHGCDILEGWQVELRTNKNTTTYRRLSQICMGYNELLAKTQLPEIEAAAISSCMDSLDKKICTWCRKPACIKTYNRIVGEFCLDAQRQIAARETQTLR